MPQNHRDVVVSECAGCPGPCAGLDRRCGRRAAQAQNELRPRVEGRGYPGQLEGIGQDLVLLRESTLGVSCE